MLTLADLADLAEAQRQNSSIPLRSFQIGGREFDFNRQPAIMGVINLSPDSWYRESVCLSTDAAIQRAQILAAQGADLVDLGAESSLAHAAWVDEKTQLGRLLPAVRGLSESKVPVSIETYHPRVAEGCLAAGADVLNLTGPENAQEIYRIARDFDAAVIICHVQGDHVRAVGDLKLSVDPIGAMKDFFERQIENASRAGLEKLVLDPGLGFYYRNLTDSADRVRHQVRAFLNTFRLRALGYPVCNALPHAFEYFRDEVRSAEPFFAVLAALGRTDILRTHEVPRVRAVLETMRHCGPSGRPD
jgi:dihydropteroate synthase